MKNIILATLLVALSSGVVLAKEPIPVVRKPAVKEQIVRPQLDRMKTGTIKKVPTDSAGNKPRDTRSGIEINPWIMPGFL